MLLYLKGILVGLLVAVAAFIVVAVIVAGIAKAAAPESALLVTVSVTYWPLPTAALVGFIAGFWWTVR